MNSRFNTNWGVTQSFRGPLAQDDIWWYLTIYQIGNRLKKSHTTYTQNKSEIKSIATVYQNVKIVIISVAGVQIS